MSGTSESEAWAAFDKIPQPPRQRGQLGLVPSVDDEPDDYAAEDLAADASHDSAVRDRLDDQAPVRTSSSHATTASPDIDDEARPVGEGSTETPVAGAASSETAARPDEARSAEVTPGSRVAPTTAEPSRSRTPDFAAPRSATSSAGRPGARMSAADLAAQRAGFREAEQVRSRLERYRVPISETRGAVDRGIAKIEVHLQRRAGALDALLDAIAEEFTAPDTEVEICSDSLVELWLPVRAEEPARKRAFWVPAALRERVREHLELTGESVTQLVLRAYNLYHDQVEGQFSADALPEGPIRIYGGKRRTDVETAVQLSVYLKRHQEAQLDETVARSGAGSRSALITALVQRYLDQHSA